MPRLRITLLGLAITVNQGVRLWVLDAQTCAQVLNELEVGFLVDAGDGYFRRRVAC